MPLPPPGIDTVAIHDLGWAPGQANDQLREWRTNGGALTLNYFPTPPDLVIRPGDDVGLSRNWGDLGSEQALLESRWIELGGFPATRTILKARLPAGMSYLGAVILPFAECSWVLKLHALEVGVTGMREAIAFDAFLGSGRPIEEWSPVAGQPADNEPLPVYVLPSDGEEWDAAVPTHPLSQVRAWLDGLAATTRFSPELSQLAPF